LNHRRRTAALVAATAALCLASSSALAQSDASAQDASRADATAPDGASTTVTLSATSAVNALTSAPSTPPSTPRVFTPPACTVDQLESLAQSAWWEGLSSACVSIIPLGARPLDPPSDADARVWHSFVGQCRSNQGRSARLLCDVPESTRAAALASFALHIRTLARRASTLQSYCPRLEALRAAVPQQAEASRPALVAAIAQLQSYCESDAAPLLAPSAVGAIGAVLGARDGGAQGEGGSRGGGAISGSAESDSAARESAHGGGRQSIAGLPTPAGMLDLAIQGLAQLIVQRAQAELEAFAIDSLRATLCSESARPWFEHTCDFLGPGGDTTLRVSVGQGLRSAFQSDVLALPTRALATLPRSGNARGLTALLYFDLLAAWVQNPDPRNAASRVLTLGEAWEPSSDAPEPRRTREINAGRQARDTVIAAGLLLSAATNREVFDRLPDTAFVPLVSAMLDRELTDADRRKTRAFRAAIAQYRAVGQGVRVTGRGAVEINATRAAAALRAVIDLLNAAVDLAATDRTIAQMVTMPGRMPELIVAISRGDLPRIVVETTRSLAALSVSFGLPETVVRGLVLAAEVASAQSPEQVRTALESVVAPVGSWRMKRRRPMVSVGALVGLGGGAEWSLAGGGIIDPRPVGSIALLGAVGLDVSFPVRSSTLGGFLSVVDLGGLMSLPTGDLQATVLGEDGSMRAGLFEVSPRVSPEQVLSPGLYFRWGIFNSPLVLVLGGSVTPLARHVQEVRSEGPMTGSVISRDVSVFRAGAFLSADVTLFPF
jgi:hypothetical protein